MVQPFLSVLHILACACLVPYRPIDVFTQEQEVGQKFVSSSSFSGACVLSFFCFFLLPHCKRPKCAGGWLAHISHSCTRRTNKCTRECILVNISFEKHTFLSKKRDCFGRERGKGVVCL